MRLLHFLCVCAALCAFAPGARAQYRNSPFSYNYLDINYVETDLSDTAPGVPELDGFGGRLSFDSPEGIRVLLSYNETSGNAIVGGNSYKIIRQDLEVGLGFITSPSDSVDLVLDLKYLRGELQQPIWNGAAFQVRNSTRSGYGAEFGVRSLLHEMVELDLSGEYRDYFVSEIGGHAGLVLMFMENFGLTARYSYFKTQSTLTAGIRLAI